MSEEQWNENRDRDEKSPLTNGSNSSNRINLQIPSQKRNRKRKQPTCVSSSILSGSSSSSSDDDDDDGDTTLAAGNISSNDGQSQHHPQAQAQDQMQESLSKRQMHQVGGWRVKLYRLNTDGSWDDCGTGRIVCLYKTSSSDCATRDSPQELLYQELGEPTLCMQAESTPPRVLLRTKILLRDAYQRQGDNIITWCEPYFEDSSQQSDGQAQGVSADSRIAW